MREIKFRVWHIIEKLWLDPWSEEDPMMSLDGEIYLYDRATKDWSNKNSMSKDICIDQYTGLKDIKGIEIYENDIIKFIPDITFEKSCVWQNWGHVWINNIDGIVISYNHPRSENSDRLCDIITEYYSVDGHMKPILKYKIIGNEHQ